MCCSDVVARPSTLSFSGVHLPYSCPTWWTLSYIPFHFARWTTHGGMRGLFDVEHGAEAPSCLHCCGVVMQATTCLSSFWSGLERMAPRSQRHHPACPSQPSRPEPAALQSSSPANRGGSPTQRRFVRRERAPSLPAIAVRRSSVSRAHGVAYFSKVGICTRRRRSVLVVRHGDCDAGLLLWSWPSARAFDSCPMLRHLA